LPYKKRIVQQLVGSDAKSARQVAKETGISQETVSRWLREARSLPLMPRTRKSKGWSLDEKIRILVEASKLTGDQLRAFLEREGLLLAEVEQWRLALDSGETTSKATTKALSTLGLEEIVSAPRSPWQNPFAERVIGSIRRELLDHVIVLDEAHARRLLRTYRVYYNETRTHLSLSKDAPDGREVHQPERGAAIVALPVLGGLHHRYERRAA
jgi:transposase InsO family protein